MDRRRKKELTEKVEMEKICCYLNDKLIDAHSRGEWAPHLDFLTIPNTPLKRI
jgi:hypothetical protein